MGNVDPASNIHRHHPVVPRTLHGESAANSRRATFCQARFDDPVLCHSLHRDCRARRIAAMTETVSGCTTICELPDKGPWKLMYCNERLFAASQISGVWEMIDGTVVKVEFPNEINALNN